MLWARISFVIYGYYFHREILHEDESFPLPQRQLAALVASKVYYHLGAFEDSLQFALGAGNLFNLSQRNEYVETTLGKVRPQHSYSVIDSGSDESVRICSEMPGPLYSSEDCGS